MVLKADDRAVAGPFGGVDGHDAARQADLTSSTGEICRLVSSAHARRDR
jgi:hypothetical protein